jgi:hypothetical protein
MTPEELHILQHALGVDQFGRGEQYRSYFVTGEGSIDFPHCMALVERGLMTRRTSKLCGGDDIFVVTDRGRAQMAFSSPAPPKLTRSQQRYRDYLDLDSDMTFIEYLRWIAHRERRAA